MPKPSTGTFLMPNLNPSTGAQPQPKPSTGTQGNFSNTYRDPQAPSTGRPPEKPITGLQMAIPRTFRHGGRVKRGGWAKLHKGERVIPARARALGAGKKRRTKRKSKKTK